MARVPQIVLLVKPLVIFLSQDLAKLLSLSPMPPKTEKGRREAAEVARFVAELYEASGLSSWGEFARASGVAAATMSDYKRAENAPSGYRLLKMIQAAGWAPPHDEISTDAEFRERVAALLREVQRRLPPPDSNPGRTAEGEAP